MLPGDGPVDPPECWEKIECSRCPDKMTPACPEHKEEARTDG